MGSSHLSHMHTTYLLNSISLSPYQLPVLLSTSLLATILSSTPPDDIHCQVRQSPFDEHKMLLCDICNAAGIWTASSHPLQSSHMEPGNVSYAFRATSYLRQPHDTFAFLPLFSISTLTKIPKKMITPHH